MLDDWKIIISWEKRKENIKIPSLESFLNLVKMKIESSEWISFSHIYKELNTEVNSLFKQALTLNEEILIEHIFIFGVMQFELKIYLN